MTLPRLNVMHPSVAEKLAYFDYGHLPPILQEVSKPFSELAHSLAQTLTGSQVTIGLQHLLEAKDCAVRAALPLLAGDPSALVGGSDEVPD